MLVVCAACLPRSPGINPFLRHASRKAVPGAVVLFKVIELGVGNLAQGRLVTCLDRYLEESVI